MLRDAITFQHVEHAGGVCDVMEEGCYALGGKRALSNSIPTVLAARRQELAAVTTGRRGSLLFDGALALHPFKAFLFWAVDDRDDENWELEIW